MLWDSSSRWSHWPTSEATSTRSLPHRKLRKAAESFAAKVHCRVGSSEKVGMQPGALAVVHCRVGSSEMPLPAEASARVVQGGNMHVER